MVILACTVQIGARMLVNSVERVTYYQNKLHDLHQYPDYEHGMAVLNVNDPALPDIDELEKTSDPTRLEIAYLKYLISDIHIDRDIAWCDNWNQDQLDYLDNHKKLGNFLRKIGKLLPLPLEP